MTEQQLATEAITECPRCRRRRKRQRITHRALGVVVLLIAVCGVAGVPVYVHPKTDPLRKADAIFLLGGYGDRRPYGFSLYEQGWAPNVVVSNPRGQSQSQYGEMWVDRWCSTSYWGSDFLADNRPWPTSTKFCPNPDPPTTLGEARAFRELAAEHGWRSVIVVTFRPHVERARLIFERCFDGDVIMTASPVDITPLRWTYEYVYQTVGLVKTLFDRGC